MKKIRILTIGIMLMMALVFTGCSNKKEQENKPNFDFRHFAFGMTKEEVEKYEANVDFSTKLNSVKEYEGYLFGETKICNLNGIITYKFSNNKLNMVSFVSDEHYANCTLYYEDYTKLKKCLIDKYGKPKTENKNKRGNLYDDNIGNAIKYEEVDFEDLWELDNGKIILKCYSRNYKPIVVIGYTPKDSNKNNETNGL